MKIPKIIHYIWLDQDEDTIREKEMPLISEQCISSFDILSRSGYEIKKWGIKELSPYFSELPEQVIEKLRQRNYIVVSDYIRFWLIAKFGGIYVDVDIEFKKNITKYIENDEAFIGLQGKHINNVNNAILGGVKGHKLFEYICSTLSNHPNYILNKKNQSFLPDLFQRFYSDSFIIDNILGKKTRGRDNCRESITYFSQEYFYPFLWHEQYKESENTICVHWWNDSNFDNKLTWYDFSVNKYFRATDYKLKSNYGIFKQCFVINLERRSDRLETVKLEFDKAEIDYNIFKAIEPKKTINKFYNKYVYGCVLSHLSIYKYIYDNKIENCLIFEDDVIFDVNFKTKVLKSFETISKNNIKWDIFYFNNKNQANVLVIDDIAKLKHQWCTHSYAVTYSFCEKVLNQVDRLLTSNNIDSFLVNSIKGCEKYGSIENLVKQNNSKSDIQIK